MTDTREALAAMLIEYSIACGELSKGLPADDPMWDELRDLGERLSAALATQPAAQPDNDAVICPKCAHQFRAIPVNVQRLMLDAGFEPPFIAQPSAQGEAVLDRESTWWSLAMGAAASLEDAANCMRDEDAERAALGAAAHVRKQCAMLASAPAAPAQAVPLTDEQIWSNDEIMAENAKAGLMMLDLVHLVRAIERAHGIAPKAAQSNPPTK